MTIRLLTATALAMALTAAPAAAAELEPLKRCYASTGPSTEELEDIRVRGTAFEPSIMVEVLIDGVPLYSAPTDAIGAFEVLVDPPYQRRGERAFTLTVRDAVNAVTVESRVTNLAVRMRPRRAAPDRRVRFRGRGFTRRAPVYAHYVYGGREQKTVRLARRSRGRCGRFSAKRRQIPIEKPRTGRWVVQFDQRRNYAPEPDPVWVRLPITVVEVFREP